MFATLFIRWRWILAVLGLFACSQAYALDMEYYVYNGFDDALDAFQRLALIFSDSNYITLFTAVVILAFVLAATVFATRGLTGGAPMDVRSWAIPLLVGVVVFRALILPKGTIYLYDPVRNENQAIGGVPDAIVLVAGTLNLLERGVVDIVDTASAYPYANEAGGITFDLIYRATAEWNDVNSFYYTMSLGRYFTDCGLPALASQAYSVNMDQLKRGTADFRTLLGAMASPANYTVYYDADNKAGLTMTCATDWQVNLSPFLSSPDSFNGVINGICAKAGLNMSSANQQTRCRELLAAAATQAGAVGTDAVGFVRQAYIASAIDRAMQDKDPDLAQKAVANRNLMVQGIGVGNYINEWMPTIRAVSLGVVLGMIPVVALFVVTPLVGQALLITAGMLVWLTLWGVTDAIMHQMAVDGAQRVFQRISDFQLGLDSIWLMPDASTKALAYFGKIRGMSMAIATVLCGLLFKMSGSLFSGAQELAQATETAGADASRLTQTESRAQLRDALVQGQASELTRSQTSMDNWVTHSAYSSMSAIGSTTAMLNAASQSNLSMNDVLQVSTASEGGGAFGSKVQSVMNVTAAMGGDPHNKSDVLNTAQLVGEAQRTLGMSNAAAFHQTMEKLGGGDATKGALRFAGIQAMQRYTGAENIARLAEMARAEMQKAGAPADELDGYRALAQVMMSQTQADLSVFGTPDQLAGFLKNHRALDKGRIAAIADVAQKYGYSVEELGAVAGRMEAAMRRGNDQAISEMGDNAIAAGFWYQAVTQGATGEFWKKWVAASGRNEAATIRDVAAYGQQRELARWQTATLVAEKLATSREGYLIQSEGANLAVAVSGPRQWDRISQEFLRAGVLTENQAAMVRAQGAAGVVRFAFDPKSGQGVQMTFQSGSAVLHEQIISDVRKDVVSEEKSRTVGLALLQPGSSSEAVLRRELPQVLTGGDKQLLEQWKTDLAAPFANIARLAKEGSVIHTLGGGAEAGLHLPRRLTKDMAKAGFDISGSSRRIYGENRSVESSRALVDIMLTESWKEATEKATAQATHSGVLNEQEFAGLRNKMATDIFLEDYRTLYGALENYAKDKGTGSILQDMRQEAKEDKQWQKDQTEHPEKMPWNQN